MYRGRATSIRDSPDPSWKIGRIVQLGYLTEHVEPNLLDDLVNNEAGSPLGHKRFEPWRPKIDEQVHCIRVSLLRSQYIQFRPQSKVFIHIVDLLSRR